MGRSQSPERAAVTEIRRPISTQLHCFEVLRSRSTLADHLATAAAANLDPLRCIPSPAWLFHTLSPLGRARVMTLDEPRPYASHVLPTNPTCADRQRAGVHGPGLVVEEFVRPNVFARPVLAQRS